MTDTITPPVLLRRAADVITERGWLQRDFISHSGQVCLVGAMRLAAAGHAGIDPDKVFAAAHGDREVWPEENRYALKHTFDESVRLVAARVGGKLIHEWNDEPGRTSDEVVALLRRAAEDGESK